MQTVILAGGKGTRLKPYTLSFPKSLVPVGDYPIIEIILRQLAQMRSSEVVISTGHLSELIMAYCGDGSKWNLKIRYVREEVPLNTAGALKLIPGLQDNFLVMNGDILTDLDYGKFFQTHLDKKSAASIAAYPRESKIDFGVLDIAADGTLANYIEKPVYPHKVSMGVYALSRGTIDLIQPNESLGMPDLLLRVKQAGKPVHCISSPCYWLDIGRVDDYERAQEKFLADSKLFLKP
jgi:NDP-sugar pyrophosphorylase family protein